MVSLSGGVRVSGPGTAIGVANLVSIYHTTITPTATLPPTPYVRRAAPAGTQKLVDAGEPFSEWVDNFLAEYLGRSEGHKVPFGGRDAELAALTSWLTEENAAPYALLTAEAGRGKSALLANWATRVQADGRADVVFVPISIRFNTAQASVALPMLASRLAAHYGEKLTSADRSSDQWQAEISAYLGRQPRSDRPLLVVIDGLDEAVGWDAGVHLFPHSPPPGVRLLVSARYVGGDADETSWRRRLNWVSPALARSIALPPLDADGVADVLHAMGDPLAGLVSRVDIVGELHRLSEGDPLLVRLYVESLVERGPDAVRLSPEELPSIEKGMRGYYDRWRRELERIWQDTGYTVPGKQRQLQEFLDLLACALGPVSRDDLAELDPAAPTGVELNLLIRVAGRFVIGDGVEQGLVFSHPRFGTFFHDLMGRKQQARWTAAFTDYGHRVLTAVRDGVLSPREAPFYAVTTYGAHLEAAHAPGDRVYELINPSWLAAWNAVAGTDAGFLNDCDRAWRCAEREVRDPSCADLDSAVEIQFLCALAKASVVARSDKVPVALLAAAYTEGVLTAAQALAICRRMTQEYRRSSALVALAPLLPVQWLDECVSM
ncbi:AAA family ATPase [Actinosynnema sp. NPDC091369]